LVTVAEAFLRDGYDTPSGDDGFGNARAHAPTRSHPGDAATFSGVGASVYRFTEPAVTKLRYPGVDRRQSAAARAPRMVHDGGFA
jgi:hypothetical protein